MTRIMLAALVTVTGLSGPGSACAQSDEWSVARAYVRQLQGLPAGTPVSGPLIANYAEVTGVRQVPITRLSALLRACRAASRSRTRAIDPPGIEATQLFECPGPDAPDKAVSVKIVVASRSTSVARVDVAFGGPINWPGPAPSGPAWKQWDQRLYDQYRAATLALVASLKTTGPLRADPRPARMELLSDEDDGVPMSADRLREILRTCEPSGSIAARIPTQNTDPREGLKTYLKCDPRSSAPSDLTLYAAFSNGEIDTVLLTTDFGYRVTPVTAAPGEK